MKNLIRKILKEELTVKKGDKLMSTKTISNPRGFLLVNSYLMFR